ncbi:MAG: DNA-primase RepB domain-containing protein [Elusimicrobiota bacterium]|nr:DNA-primase RepB domain-containing protein [Elusimicrobiota bacterium]
MEREILEKFFYTIFRFEGNYFIEIRYKKDTGEVKQKFVERNMLNQLINNFIEYEDTIKKYEMWYGVCPRINKSGTKQDIKQVFNLWCDIDNVENAKLNKILEEFPFPSIMVSSGNGYHLYWLLNQPFTINCEEDMEYIEKILKGISLMLGGDKTHDITRILRIPETFNNKDKNNPKKVLLNHIDTSLIYDIKDFEKYIIIEEITKNDNIGVFVENVQKIDINKYIKELPIWCIEAIKEGFKENDHKYKSRSELDLAVMMCLIKHNFTDEMIYSIFTDPEYKISSKTLEKGKNAKSYFELTLQKAKNYYQIKREEFIKKVEKYKDFDEVIQVYKNWFHIEDDDYLRIIHSCIIAHKFDAKPLWLLLLAPPSGTKTSVLQDLHVLEKYNVRFISELTAKTFVSGDKYYKGLLDEIKNGIIIFKDLTTILQLDSTSRNEIMQQLREVWDGMYDKKFGTGKSVHWEGKITVIAGCTEAYESYREIDQTLGERFLIYRPLIEQREKMVWMSLQQVGKEKQMRKEIQQAIQSFHNSIDFDIDDDEYFIITQEILEKIVSLADVITLLRSGVKRDYKKDIEYVPEPELPARLAQQLLILLKALALLNKNPAPGDFEYNIVKKLALMTVPLKKYKILKFFVSIDNEMRTTSEVAQSLNIPRQTIYRYLEEMWCFKIMKKTGSEDRPNWQIDIDFLTKLKTSGI